MSSPLIIAYTDDIFHWNWSQKSCVREQKFTERENKQNERVIRARELTRTTAIVVMIIVDCAIF